MDGARQSSLPYRRIGWERMMGDWELCERWPVVLTQSTAKAGAQLRPSRLPPYIHRVGDLEKPVQTMASANFRRTTCRSGNVGGADASSHSSGATPCQSARVSSATKDRGYWQRVHSRKTSRKLS